MKILLVGESWVTHSYHIKGADSFLQSGYGEGTKWLRQVLEESGHSFAHLPSHIALNDFPNRDQLSQYDVVIFSDVGSNTLLLPAETAVHSVPTPNRLKLIQEYVSAGGGFVMIGGYMSFQGIEGKARFKGTPVEEILPVNMESVDDRVEIPQGISPVAKPSDHPILKGLPHEWPQVLGYNRVTAKEDGTVLVVCGNDPLVAVGQYGKGRTMAFTTDCAPHWAPPEFLNWSGYAKFWNQAVEWLAK